MEEIVKQIDWREAGGGSEFTALGLIDGVEVVFHQAASASIARSVDDPLASNHANVTGTLNLTQASRSAGVKRFIYAASSSAYGNTAVLPKVESMCLIRESLCGEQICRVTCRALIHGLCGDSLPEILQYLWTHAGPQFIYSAVVPRFIAGAGRRSPDSSKRRRVAVTRFYLR